MTRRAPTPFFMVATLLFVIIAELAYIAHAVAGEPKPPAMVMAVMECGHVVSVIIVAADGTRERVVPDATNAGALIDLMKVAEKVVVVQMDCTKGGHDSI